MQVNDKRRAVAAVGGGSGSIALDVVATTALLVAIALLAFYLAVFYPTHFGSDDAVANMLGETLWAQGRLLPVGWINNNGDLMIPSGALIVAPLLRWFANGYALHAAASYFAIVLELGSIAYLLNTLRIPRLAILLILTFVVAGVSYEFMVMIFAQTTYVWWSAGFCLAAGLICSERLDVQASARIRLMKSIALFAVVFCISFANPARVFLMMVLPLYVFDRVVANACRERAHAPPSFLRRSANALGVVDRFTLSTLVAGFSVAAIAYSLLMFSGRTEGVRSAVGFWWGGFGSVWKHIATFEYWIAYLGGRVHAFDANPSSFLLLRPFRFAAAAGLTVISVCEISRLRRTREPARRALAIALIAAFVPVFIVYALFEPLAVNGVSLRYFIVPISIVIVLPAFVFRDALLKWPSTVRVAMTVCSCLLVLVAVQRFMPLAVFSHGVAAAATPSTRLVLAKRLQQLGLHWGYASWWSAGATTVLSNADVRVSPINIGPSGWITPAPFMILKDWYRPSAWAGPSFLALEAREASPRMLDQLRLYLGEPRNIIDAQPYTVLVFNDNIANRFGCEKTAVLNKPLQRNGLTPELVSAELGSWLDPRVPQVLKVRLRNRSADTVSGQGRYPLSVGVKLLADDGHVVDGDWVHAALGCPVGPKETLDMNIALPKIPSGKWQIRVDLVQEHVAWMGNWGAPTLTLDGVVGATATNPAKAGDH